MKDHKSFRGNSVLLQVIDKYVYIGMTYTGSEIYEFKPSDEDEIIEYYSLVGNNDVPYPVAIGKKNVYFMLEQRYTPIKYLSTGEYTFEHLQTRRYISDKIYECV